MEELLRVAIEERVPAIAHSFANPTPYVATAHESGTMVLAQVQTVAQAAVVAGAGVDVIAAQGTEAGGHTGYSGTLPLVPAVVHVAQGIPVVAAGGIADGRGLAAVLMLGAEGAWMGTRFVASPEATTAEWGKERVIRASTDDTVLTRAYDIVSGAPFPSGIGDRVLRNTWTDAWHGRDEELLTRREELNPEVIAAMGQGNADVAPSRAGNAVGLIHAIEPAGDIVRRVVAEAERLLRDRPGQVLR